MPLLHIIILSIIQGITEFLPISSSGHLLLFHGIWGTDGSRAAEITNLILDIAVHVGTLFAVLLYFWRDMAALTTGAFKLLAFNTKDKDARLALHLIISSIPVVIAGYAMHSIDPLWLRHTWIVAATTIIFGIILWWADAQNPADRDLKETTFKDSLLIGLAQILALIPGTSRSGITMTASRFLGFTRKEAARYSLLLSTVAISGAGTIGGLDAMEVIDQTTPEFANQILIAISLSFITALVAIALMMKWLENQDFKIFAIYRIILGIGLFAALGFGIIT